MKTIVFFILSVLASFASDADLASLYFHEGKYQKAMEIYKTSCDEKNTKACYNLGYMYEKGYGVSKDNTQAFSSYKKACELGDIKGCSKTASFYAQGEGVEQNLTKALELYGEVCSKEQSAIKQEACEKQQFLNHVIKQAADSNTKKIILPNKEAEKQYKMQNYQKACDLGSGKACYELTKYKYCSLPYTSKYVQKHVTGTYGSVKIRVVNAPNDYRLYDKTISLLKSECDLSKDALSCSDLADIYGEFAVDDETASRDSCYFPTDYAQSVRYYKKACELGYSQACKNFLKANKKRKVFDLSENEEHLWLNKATK